MVNTKMSKDPYFNGNSALRNSKIDDHCGIFAQELIL